VGDDAVIYAKSDILVNGETNNTVVTYTGSTTHGADLGLGVTVTVNSLENNIGAHVGEGGGALPGVTVPASDLIYDNVNHTLTSTTHNWMNDGLKTGDWIRISNFGPVVDGIFRIKDMNATVLELEPSVKAAGTGVAGVVTIQKMGRLQADGQSISLETVELAG
jgi:hypothetical protein